jgi:hypothetical protein
VAAALTVGHGALGFLCLAAAFLPERARGVVVRMIATGGVAVGIALVVARSSGDAWRTIRLDSTGAAVAGAAAACAWLLVAVLQLGTERWRIGALVGVAATGLAGFASNQWLVPALLFWLCSSAAIAAVSVHATAPVVTWLGLGVSDGLLAIALVLPATSGEEWRLVNPVEGWSFWMVVAAALVRVGIVPKVGAWGVMGSPAAPVLPLLVGGGFALVGGPATRPEPWLALALLAVALGVVGYALARVRASLSAAAPWPVLVSMGVAFLAPEEAGVAALGALLPVAALALWHESSARTRPGRALVLAFVPTTAGFAAVVAGATASFDRAVGGSDLEAAVPWMAASALLPVALAGSVVLGARIGRGAWEGSAPVRTAALDGAVAVLVIASLIAGLSPTGPLSFRWQDETWLYLLALLCGSWAAAEAWRRRSSGGAVSAHAPEPEPRPPLGVLTVGSRPGRVLTWVAAVLGLAMAGGVTWITVEGLRRGFL